MELCLLNRASFAGVYRLMEESFPPDEIRPCREQQALLDDPRYGLYGLQDADGSIQGVMAVWQFSEFTFLEHFAVAPQLRNQGVGSAMLHALARLTQKEICLEAEPPETDLKRRRVEFYKRNGFLLQDYPYMQPAISQGRKPVPLVLMTTRAHTREGLDRIKTALYRTVYRTDKA